MSLERLVTEFTGQVIYVLTVKGSGNDLPEPFHSSVNPHLSFSFGSLLSTGVFTLFLFLLKHVIINHLLTVDSCFSQPVKSGLLNLCFHLIDNLGSENVVKLFTVEWYGRLGTDFSWTSWFSFTTEYSKLINVVTHVDQTYAAMSELP